MRRGSAQKLGFFSELWLVGCLFVFSKEFSNFEALYDVNGARPKICFSVMSELMSRGHTIGHTEGGGKLQSYQKEN